MTEHNDEAPEATDEQVGDESTQAAPASDEAPKKEEAAAAAEPSEEEGADAAEAADEADDSADEGDDSADEGDDSEDEADDSTDEGDDAEDDDIAFLDPDDDDVEQEVAVVEPKLVEELRRRVQALRGDLDKTRRESNTYKERLLRSAADFDNFRKRSQREKAELEKFAVEKVVSEMLPVIDNLERALSHGEKTVKKQEGEPSDAAQGLLEGVQMVLRQFRSQLEKHGVKGFESHGEKFDPERHEAVQQVDSDEHETGAIVEVYQRGYFIHDRLLRPAMVVVARNTASGD